MYEFEKHPKLTEFVLEMANTGKAPKEWTGFIETLNQALRIHDVVGRSEQLVCEHPDEAIIRDKPTDYCMACNRNI